MANDPQIAGLPQPAHHAQPFSCWFQQETLPFGCCLKWQATGAMTHRMDTNMWQKLCYHDKAVQDRQGFIDGCAEIELHIRDQFLLHHSRQVLGQRRVLLLQPQLLHLDQRIQLFQLLVLPAHADQVSLTGCVRPVQRLCKNTLQRLS